MAEAYRRNLITTRDGNISYFDEDAGSILITPSGANKSCLEPKEICTLHIMDGSILIDSFEKPSGELEMHWLLHKDYLKKRAVVHLHPTYTIAAIQAGVDLEKVQTGFPELSRYTKVGKTIEVIPPITLRLAVRTHSEFRMDRFGNSDINIVGQSRHGVCAIGETPLEAFEHIERLEHICKIIVTSGTATDFS
jgi:ribulose-5-phosphate 4-epimerase/fuculose-1-phosphate aldolase